MAKTITWAIVIIIIAVGAWFLWNNSRSMQGGTSGQAMQQTETTSNSTAEGNTSGSSGSSVDQSMTQVDSELQVANGAGTQAQSFNDTQVQQTE